MNKREFLEKVRKHRENQKAISLLGVLSVMMLFVTALVHINLGSNTEWSILMLVVMWIITLIFIMFFISSIFIANNDKTEYAVYEAFVEYAKTLPENEDSPSK